MNFSVSRAELIAVTGFRRTKTFELQKSGHLRPTSRCAGKTWFCLVQVLQCSAALHGMEPPDPACIMLHATAVIQARLSSQAKRR